MCLTVTTVNTIHVVSYELKYFHTIEIYAAV